MKEGPRQGTCNYSWISSTDTFGKVFDIVLCKRLEKWFRPETVQAGVHSDIGCLEHIMTLRLAIDYTASKKQQLYIDILFVYFVKVYDKVPCGALIHTLIKYGCGYLIILALATIYRNTNMILSLAIITISLYHYHHQLGVRRNRAQVVSCLRYI